MFDSILHIIISNIIQIHFVFKCFLNVLSLNWEKNVESIEEVFEVLTDETIGKSDYVEDAGKNAIEILGFMIIL